MNDVDEVLQKPDPPPMNAGPLGDWVIVPDGRIGQVWAQHPDHTRYWVAFGKTKPEAFRLTELQPAEGAAINHEQEGLPL